MGSKPDVFVILATSSDFSRAAVPGILIEALTDTEIADRSRWDSWFEHYRFRGPMGDRNFTPSNPYEETAQ